MSISTHSRRGTSVSFWRNHNAMQLMMAQACMPSLRRVPMVKHEFILPPTSSIRSIREPAPKGVHREDVVGAGGQEVTLVLLQIWLTVT